MRKLLFILVSIFILLSCENNSTDSIKNESDLNTFISTKLAGTWKVDGFDDGFRLWKFITWNTFYYDTLKIADYYKETRNENSSLTLLEWNSFYQDKFLDDYYAMIHPLNVLSFDNDSLLLANYKMPNIKIKFITNKTFVGFHYVEGDIIGTLIE